MPAHETHGSTPELGQTVQNILGQLAQTPNAIGSIQLIINLSQQTQTLSTLVQQADMSAGLWMRKVVDGGNKVRISFIPDDPNGPREDLIENNKDHVTVNKAWKDALKNPPGFDINMGTTIMRLSADATNVQAIWLPDDITKAPIGEVTSQDTQPPDTTDPILNGSDFLGCISNSGGGEFFQKFVRCTPSLFKR